MVLTLIGVKIREKEDAVAAGQCSHHAGSGFVCHIENAPTQPLERSPNSYGSWRAISLRCLRLQDVETSGNEDGSLLVYKQAGRLLAVVDGKVGTKGRDAAPIMGEDNIFDAHDPFLFISL